MILQRFSNYFRFLNLVFGKIAMPFSVYVCVGTPSALRQVGALIDPTPL